MLEIKNNDISSLKDENVIYFFILPHLGSSM